jgi:hypothetical protein
MRILFLSFLLSSCVTDYAHRVDLPQGDVLLCKNVYAEKCGLSLIGCGKDASADFKCLHEVEYVGPWKGPMTTNIPVSEKK